MDSIWLKKINNFLLNDMITKIDARKIKHQSNIRIFVWNCNNIIENKVKQDQFKINQILKDET